MLRVWSKVSPVRNANSQVLPRPFKSETLGAGAGDLCSASAPGNSAAPSSLGTTVLQSCGEEKRWDDHEKLSFYWKILNFGRYLEMIKWFFPPFSCGKIFKCIFYLARVIGQIVPHQNSYIEVLTPLSQDVTVFKEVIRVEWGPIIWALTQYDWCPCKKKEFKYR